MTEKILALSWKQPFVGLMLPPHDKIETRTWPTKYRGLVLICASQQSYKLDQIKAISGEEQFLRIIEISPEIYSKGHLATGNAIAVGRLVDCRLMTKEDEAMCFVQYREPWQEKKKQKDGTFKMVTKKLYCHIYKDVHAIKPISWKGSQGWKEVSKEIINQIEFI